MKIRPPDSSINTPSRKALRAGQRRVVKPDATPTVLTKSDSEDQKSSFYESATKAAKDGEPRLHPGHRYYEGELTADCWHRYCRHYDLFLPLDWYRRDHDIDTGEFNDQKRARVAREERAAMIEAMNGPRRKSKAVPC